MLTVKTPEETSRLLRAAFPPRPVPERVPAGETLGRVLYSPVAGEAYIPGFHRSTVDGFAVRCADTFGCSDSIPALLTLTGEIAMGRGAVSPLAPGCCAAIPTGGALPPGADGVVMLEYAESFGDGTVALSRPAAPGENLIYKGDDVYPGKEVLPAGRRLTAADLGALAAMGVTVVTVCRRPVVGILSTGNELVPVSAQPGEGQVRDVNSVLLAALCSQAGGVPRQYPILPDREEAVTAALGRALEECDLVLLSGGSSVGAGDTALAAISAHGEILLHGIAMKPGKPTIVGSAVGKPVFGLPGHPVAAFFVAHLFVRPLIARLMGAVLPRRTVPAVLTESVSANHGRAQYTGVVLECREGSLYARPVRSKSGLITTLAVCDGYLCVPRDCEGLPAGVPVSITLFSLE